MTFPFVRRIEFIIPATGNTPIVQVIATEVDGNLVFELEVQAAEPGQQTDLRGLFLNLNDREDISGSDLAEGLEYENGEDITDFKSDNIINFKNGTNLKGRSKGYDIGINFGTPGVERDEINSTSFTLLGLTLDDIANVQFGARINGNKLTVEAPAAPDAKDDSRTINEESAPNLDSPSTIPTGTVFHILENDTDADADKLTITQIATGEHGPQHGTVEIVDGDDDDELIGDAVLYTPFEDYSGDDSFYYLVDDGNGGTDFAKVDININSVADIPDLSYEILTGDTVNQVVIRVTTAHTDADGSEYIDRIELAGLPATGVVVSESIFNTSDQPSSIVEKDFILTLDKELDFNFDLTLTSVAKEKSNDDEETKSTNIAISYNEEDNHFDPTFEANDQSMWAAGDAFQFTDDRFWGVDGTADYDKDFGIPYVDIYGTYKFGLESSLSLDGGLVDAEAPFSVDVDSYYNHSTDWLRIETAAVNNIGNSWFTTSSPDLNYSLDLVGDVDMDMTIGASLDLSKDVWEKTGTEWVGGFWESVTSWVSGYWKDVFGWVPYDFSFDASTTLSPDFSFDFDLITFDGKNLSFGPDAMGVVFEDSYSWDLGDFFTVTAEVPHIYSSSITFDSDTLSGRGTTKDDGGNFLQLSFDVDKALATLAQLPFNPLGDSVTIKSIFEVGYDILNYELKGNIDIGQDYFMDILGLDGQILFEDNSLVDFTFGDDLDFYNASAKDFDEDGLVEYALLLSPEAKFYSELFLNPSLDHTLEFGKLYGSIDTPWPFSDITVEAGPAYTPIDDTLIETDITLVGLPEFDFNFESQTQLGLVA